MKNIAFYTLLLVVFLFHTSCSKQKYCALPEGIYEGNFFYPELVEGAIFVSFEMSKSDENSYLFREEYSTGTLVKRNKCSIGGNIGGLHCIGKIYRKNGVYTIQGTHVNGTFELKSKKD